MEHYPAQDRPSASAPPAAASRLEKPDNPNTAPAVRAPAPPETLSNPLAPPHRRASRLLPLVVIGVMLGLALLSLAVSLRL